MEAAVFAEFKIFYWPVFLHNMAHVSLDIYEIKCIFLSENLLINPGDDTADEKREPAENCLFSSPLS